MVETQRTQGIGTGIEGGSDLRVTGATVRQLRIPFERPMRTATFPIEAVDTALVELHTDAGVDGVGWAFGFGPPRVAAVVRLVEALLPFVEGKDPFATEQIQRALRQATGFIGQSGISSLAIAAIDTACWDVKGRALGIPVHRLLGAARDRVEVYASSGLWLDRSLDELRREAAELVDAGFRAVKMRMGLPDAKEDLARLRAVREAVGEEVLVMVDANQAWSVAKASRMAQEMEEFDVFWLEEPVAYDDVRGMVQVRSASTVALCTGENNFLRGEFRELLETGAADYVMPDLMRVGGPTEFMKIGHLADSFATPLTPHLFMEASLHLAAALPNGVWQEHQPWWQPILRDPIVVEDGAVALTDAPGFGVELDPEAVSAYEITSP